uniref:Uncharacterized protein n=1 Tax=Oryza nivara TaxID=4536 RepID=A0A0E0HHI3_ORYNI
MRQTLDLHLLGAVASQSNPFPMRLLRRIPLLLERFDWDFSFLGVCRTSPNGIKAIGVFRLVHWWLDVLLAEEARLSWEGGLWCGVDEEVEAACGDGVVSSSNEMQELWPLGEVDQKGTRFPCCIVWTPLPVVSWLAPYIGHVGIAREDGTVMDFAGSNFVSVDDLAYGSAARYLQLDRRKCCFPANLAAHVCARSYEHSEAGTAISWDDALQSGARRFEHKCYNLFTCNSHSFVASCLNRLAYGGSVGWNVLNLAALVWLRGRWLGKMAVVRSLLPFAAVACVGVLMAGWSFLISMAAFSSLLLGWFVLGVYCFKGLVC